MRAPAQSAIRVVRHARGPRVYVFGVRLHHGTAGVGTLTLGLIFHRRALVLVGLAALTHDARDFPFRDADNH